MRVARLPNAPLLSLTSGERRALLARPHPLLPGHVGLVDQNGTYHMVKLGEGGSRASVAAVYELQLFTEGGFTQLPLCKEWRDFAHLPDDGLVLCHRGSGRILFAQLPLCEGEHGAVFLFGSHDGPVLSLATNRQLLLSGGADGCVRLWSLDSGAMIDCCRRAADGAAAGQVTAVAFVGPLMVAAGTDHGVVCLYDISTSRLEAVQRFRAGDGPISALAGRLTRRQAHDVVTAAGPRGLDGGGVVEGPVGLPWRSAAAGAVGDGGTETLLAVASPAGWLHVFRAAGSGEDAWQLVHEGALAGEPFLSCSPDGNYLAVGSGSCLEVLDATTLQVVHEQLVSPLAPLAGAGFLPGSAGGSTLVALPAGGTLAGGIRMRLFAAPAAQEPLMLQLTVPLLEPGNEGQRYAEAARDDDFLTWLHRSATATHSTGTATAAATAPGAGSAAPVAAAARLLKGLTLSGSPPGDRGGLAAASPAAPRNPAWGWQAFAPTTSPSQSPRADVQAGDGTGGVQADRSPSAEPWASPPAWASGARAGAAAAAAPGSAGQARQPGAARSPLGSAGRGRSALASSPRGARTGSGGKEFGGVTRGSEAGPGGGGAGGGEAAAAAHEWKAYRPATQPAPRSWITGLPPRSDFLPQSVPPSPQQLQQQAQASSAQRGSPAQTRPGAAATPTSPAVSRLVAAAAEARTAGGQLRLASGSSPVITAAGEAFTPGDDGEEVLDDGALESEPEMPCSGTLLPASGIPAAAAASASSGRYATTTTATTATGGLFDDADDDDGAAVVGGPAWAAESQKGSRYPEPRGARGADTQRPAPGAAAAAAVGSGYPDTAGAEAFAAPDGRVWAEGREYSFTQGGWGPEGGRGGGGGGGGLSGYGQSGGEMAAAEASWREGDLDMAPSGFRPPTSTSAAAAPSNGPTRGGALGTSFRFQLPQQHQQQPPLRWEGSQASAGPPQPGSMPLHGHEAEGDAVAQVEYAPDGWVADDEDPLGRTAYFGDALSAAIQGGLDASAGGWPMDDILDKLEELPRQGLGAQHPEANGRQAATAARGLSGAAAAWDKASGLAQRDGEEELGAQKRGGEEQEEEESPEPRGAADLPAPQPEWSGQHLARQRQRGPGPGSDGQGSADEEEPEAVSPIPAAVRRNLALGGFPVAAAAQPEADGIAAAAAARSGPPGTEEEEAWGGWTNVDVLRGPVANGGGGAAAAAAAQRGAPRDIQGPPARTARPAPQPRQPPASSSSNSRMDLPLPLSPSAVAADAPGSGPGSRSGLGAGTGAAAWDVSASPSGPRTSDGSRARMEQGQPDPPAASQRPALSAFRGFKPNHAKIMQQLRRKPVPPAVRAVASGGAQLQPRYGADDGGDDATPTSSVSNEGDRDAPPSLLQSPSVLLGSPNASATTHTSGPRAAPGGARHHPLQQQQQQQQHPQRPAPGAGASASARTSLASASSAGRLQLQHLRQLRQHQQQSQLLQRRGKPTHGSQTAAAVAAAGPVPEAAAAAAASRSPQPRSTSPWQTPAQRISGGPGLNDQFSDGDQDGREGQEGEYPSVRGAGDAAGLDGAVEEEEEEEEGVGEVEGPAGDVFLQVPGVGSSALLLRKMQALRQVLTRPAATAAATRARPATHARGRGGGGGAGLPVDVAADAEAGLGVGVGAAAGDMSEAAWEEAARRAATSAANVPPAATLYRDLPPLDDPALQQPARLAKQLHPGWVASRQVKPEMGALWRPADLAREVCNTRGVALYVPPSPAEVAASALGLQWLC